MKMVRLHLPGAPQSFQGVVAMRWSVVVLAAAVVLGVTSPAGAQEDAGVPDGIETTSGVTEPSYPEQVTEEYRVETEHGTMYGWVTRPDPEAYPELYADGQGDQGPGVPVILVLSPYNSLYQPVAGGEFTLTRDEQTYFPERGYAYAQFDVIGTRESGGCYDYGGTRERETGAAVIDFLGEQEWSNGNVGMIGGSYDGTTQIAAAVEQPEHLAAIVPQVAIDRWYDYAYGGGIRYFLNSEDPSDEGFDTPFAFDFGFALIPPSSLDPASGDVLAERINPCDRLLHTQRGYEADPVYDAFWEERDYRRLASRVQAPVLLEGGWLDHNVKHWDTTQFYEALPDDLPKKMVIGQWAHSGNQFADAVDIRHAWFDQWLLGIDTGVMDLPPVDSELNTGKRTQLADWPPPGTRDVKVWLTGAATPRRLGLQDAQEPTYRDSDKRLTEDEALGGACNERCLVFLTEPLERGVRISGQPTLHLTATSDQEATHYVPVLFHEDPEGNRSVISRGFLNARNRESLSSSEPLTPGEPYTAAVPIWDVDYRVPAGHRLGVTVQSTNVIWALPDEESAATNTLTLAGESWLELPLSAGAASLRSPRPRGQQGAVGGETGNGNVGSGDDGESSVGSGPTAPVLPATGGGLVVPALFLLGAAACLRRR